MKNYKHRYYLKYNDNIRTRGKSLFYYTTSKVTEFETDNVDELYEMIALARETKCTYIIALDTVNKKILFADTLFNINSVLARYEIYEEYFGDGKKLKDFIDPNIAARDKMSNMNNYPWCGTRSERDASTKYEKYLKEKWGHNSKKSLPNLVIYDDPHMTEQEYDELKKAEKEKLNTIVERCGW